RAETLPRAFHQGVTAGRPERAKRPSYLSIRYEFLIDIKNIVLNNGSILAALARRRPCKETHYVCPDGRNRRQVGAQHRIAHWSRTRLPGTCRRRRAHRTQGLDARGLPQDAGTPDFPARSL